MKFDTRSLIEIIGVASVVASLIFVGSELRLSRLIAQTEGFAAMQEINTNLRQLQLENADIWERGCLGEELSSSEKMVFAKLHQATVGRYFTAWARAGTGVLNTGTTQFERVVAQNRYRYPGFNDMWIESRRAQSDQLQYSLAPGSFNASVEDIYQYLLESGAPRELDVAFCGQ